MNAYPYTSGHLLVAPLRHESTLVALDRDEAAELMFATQRANQALTAAYRPGRDQRRGQHRPGGRRRRARPRARARPAPLGRRHQLHDLGGGDPGAAREPAGQLRQAPRGLAGARVEPVTDEPRARANATGSGTAGEPDGDALPEDLDVTELRRPDRLPRRRQAPHRRDDLPRARGHVPRAVEPELERGRARGRHAARASSASTTSSRDGS